jgi:hypothetical protein
MQLKSATFRYEDGGKTWHVVFLAGLVKLWWTSQTQQGGLFRFENSDRTWKPCQSHAQDLIRLVSQKPTRCNQAAQRVKATRPVLRSVSR